MSDLTEIRSVVEQAARTALAPTDVMEIDVQDAIGQDGEALLRITVVISELQFESVGGDRFLDALVEISDSVREKARDDRLTVVRYTTPSDPAEDVDPES